MTNHNSLLFLFVLIIISCKPIKYNNYIFNEYKDLDVGSHASEGGLARLDVNKIIAIYRKDTTLAHISNHSKIVSKISKDNGDTWEEEKEVFDSPYDDRNLIIGNLNNGNIIIVFRRYNASDLTTVDSGYIISNDKGITWSKYVKIENTEGIDNQPFGSVFHEKKESAFLICFDKGIVKKFSSADDFTDSLKQTTIVNDSNKILQEPFLVSLSNNKKIILFRNGDGRKGQCSFYQYNSSGETFYYKGETNIFNDLGYSVRSPVSLRFDQSSNLLEVCTNSRLFNFTTKNEKNEMRIYSQDADSVFYNPKAYQLKIKSLRPMPNNHWFYGYPKFLNLSKNEVLYIITDSKINNLNLSSPLSHIHNEQANLYTFKIKTK